MDLPFTRAQFFEVMASYNQAVWPAQALLVACALAVAWLVLRPTPTAGRWVSGVLALLWAWMGIAYHWLFFAAINQAAWAFGAVSLAGALAFVWLGVLKKAVVVSLSRGVRQRVGWALVVFAMLVYPIVCKLLGHDYPAAPTFGLPCPTTIFTIGVLLLMTGPRWVYVAPLLWTVVGSTAAFLLGVHEDLGLIAAGVAGAWAALER